MSVMPFPDASRPTRSELRLAERIDHLGRVPMFEGCPKRHLRHIARLSSHRVIEAEQNLVTEGDPSNAAFLLIAGRAAVHRDGQTIAELGPGDFAGELGLILNRPRRATVRTLTPVEYLRLDRRSLRQAIDEYPRLAWHLLETVTSRLADATPTATV